MKSPLASDIERAGSLAAGVLLYQIRFWAERAVIQRDGKRWIAKSREEWSAETGLTLKQVKTALQLLRDRQIIDTNRAWFGSVQRLHVHYRSEEDAKHDGPYRAHHFQSDGPYRALQSRSDGPYRALPNTETTLNRDHEEQRGARCAMPSPTRTAREMQEALGKKSMTPKRERILIHRNVKNVTELEMLWRATWGETTDAPCPWWGPQDRNRMKHVLVKCGADAGVLLHYTMTRWTDFVAFVAKREPIFSVPDLPAVAFVARFAQYGAPFRFHEESRFRGVDDDAYDIPD